MQLLRTGCPYVLYAQVNDEESVVISRDIIAHCDYVIQYSTWIRGGEGEGGR